MSLNCWPSQLCVLWLPCLPCFPCLPCLQYCNASSSFWSLFYSTVSAWRDGLLNLLLLLFYLYYYMLYTIIYWIKKIHLCLLLLKKQNNIIIVVLSCFRSFNCSVTFLFDVIVINRQINVFFLGLVISYESHILDAEAPWGLSEASHNVKTHLHPKSAHLLCLFVFLSHLHWSASNVLRLKNLRWFSFWDAASSFSAEKNGSHKSGPSGSSVLPLYTFFLMSGLSGLSLYTATLSHYHVLCV